MHRFYIPAADWNPDQLLLSPEESHHAMDVLRLERGQRVVVFNGTGTEITAEIAEATKGAVRLKAQQTARTPRLKAAITLGQAIPKGKNMDLIVQKATELGATIIAPLLSERTVVQIDSGDSEKKRAKWQEIVVEAAKQCGQNWLPEVAKPLSPKAFFDQGTRYDLMLIASLQQDARPLKSVLAAVEKETGKPPASVLILVGPEGDFTPAEIALAKSHGCHPITLGPIVLRTETASLYCLSVLAHELF
ncbi:MAG TPA: 16S rRNA (uracil(1498)-N(3))-methyltransferase [Chthoniobacterales bacterium]